MMDWAFLLKKIIAACSMPLPLLLFGLVLLWVLVKCRKTKTAYTFASILIISFYLISIKVTPDYLAYHLESQYPVYSAVPNESLDYVLVLGSGHISDERLPIGDLLDSHALKRLIEGMRVYRLNPGSKLLLSGYNGSDELTHAQAQRKLALHFGVPEDDLILDGTPKDTKEEALNWTAFANGKKIALVTSASHMPRSMFLFEDTMQAQGVNVHITPAPTDFIGRGNSQTIWRDWFPSGRHIKDTERVWHEYLGMLWANLVRG